MGFSSCNAVSSSIFTASGEHRLGKKKQIALGLTNATSHGILCDIILGPLVNPDTKFTMPKLLRHEVAGIPCIDLTMAYKDVVLERFTDLRASTMSSYLTSTESSDRDCNRSSHGKSETRRHARLECVAIGGVQTILSYPFFARVHDKACRAVAVVLNDHKRHRLVGWITTNQPKQKPKHNDQSPPTEPVRAQAKGKAQGKMAEAEARAAAADALSERGDWPGAARMYESSLEADASNLHALANFAVLCTEMLDAVTSKGKDATPLRTKAVSLYSRALAQKPDWFDGHYNLANLLADSGPEGEATAIVHYREALKLEPNDGDVHNNLSICLLNAGQLGVSS
ncbi:UDP-N-acetylglucosamine--peptide N-acetylglucosaminyltransferase 110 kDa subunit [Hondaea fermentalgiana]|uniref:UDP-N-acetylglucosamine--peptide N-acetylglucosaminyltransferase 110 kDa subunit n=1 Tax=Hondaea fermentalgiana TaxID=2315210 RepID=A0A2R5GKV0_9STRA|nr:UDP-N-acetylglucosamine--peptide N-acetylglucosaminyltransferase 110 kDa subunit [Hondaea fermentalgiana]|eukprot:GBG30939.1 UDP-N-acetylglucosamine--peptide N-acetylglucosaminyltransferase 110 kDa subunit [Hondaea fermentalgiana]